MWKHTVSVLVIVTVTNYARANISPEIANKIQCCECKSMVPPEMRDIEPQLGPSPFEIKIAKNLTAYHLTPDINVNLTSVVEDRKFRSFMIEARRIDSTRKTDEAIGWFSVLDPIDAVQDCQSSYGAALVNSVSNINEKTNVRLAWKPYGSFQGHIEFRATFVEDEKTYWLLERSRPLYDPSIPQPPKEKPKYIPPPIPRIDVTGCGSTKGCYRVPEDCVEIECEYIFTWKNKGALMEYEMSALTDGFNDRYFAVGFSEDIYMGKDMVFECVHNSSRENVEVFQSFNLEDEHVNVRLQNPKVGIDSEEGSYNSGRLRCRFSKTKAVKEAEDFDLSNNVYHLLMARGRASNGHIRRHGLTVGHLPAVSPDEIDVLRPIDVSGRARYHLVKAHACLMLLAWVFFAPIGLIWMKYYTTMWPNSRFLGEKYWFVSHANCTFWVVLLVVVGVILIFLEASGWSEFPELPLKAHPILGIIVFICVLIIPFIAIIRCPETHTCRPVGNWFYWLFWTIAFCLAIPNIFIGMEFGKAMVPWWLTWILCIFFLFNFICEVMLEVHQCCTHKKNKERRQKWELQKKENPNAHIPEPWPVGRNFKRNVLFTHFIVCLIVVIIAVITVAVS